MFIREATKDDVEIIYDLIMAIARHHNQEEHVLTSQQELLNAGFSEPLKFGVLLAEVDKEIAGYISYTWNYSIWLGGNFMNIDDVFVWERYRGQKVGEALMIKAKEVCKNKDVQKMKWEVESENQKAIKFYKHLGADVDIKGICRWRVG